MRGGRKKSRGTEHGSAKIESRVIDLVLGYTNLRRLQASLESLPHRLSFRIQSWRLEPISRLKRKSTTGLKHRPCATLHYYANSLNLPNIFWLPISSDSLSFQFSYFTSDPTTLLIHMMKRFFKRPGTSECILPHPADNADRHRLRREYPGPRRRLCRRLA